VSPRALLLPVYLPALLFSIGQGAIIPMIPLLAHDVGASVALAGIVVAMRGIGTIAFDIPAGQLVGRWGERRTVVLGTAMLVVSGVGCIVSGAVALIAAFVFLMGCGWAIWMLARLSFVTDVVPPERRGRALSILGGVNRAGNFVGPFVGAGVVTLGGLDTAFVLQAVAAGLGCALLLLVREPIADGPGEVHASARFREIVRDHAEVFATAGAAASCVSLLRAARQVIIPLWGAQLGFSPSQIALVFGLSAGLDLLLFYPSGLLADRVGRKIVAIPCLGLLATGLVLLPFATTTTLYVLIALLLGAGNGMGTGIVMILGADFSPSTGRAEFLGVWRLVTDIGLAGGPLVVAAAAGLVSLAFASALLGVVGLGGTLFLARFVPETRIRPAEP
jgi:MFS family permease